MKWAARASGLVILSLLGASCAGPGPGGASKEKGILLTTFQPLFSFASKVIEGSPVLEVVNLAPPNLGPHDFNLEDPTQGERCRAVVHRAVAVVTLRSLPVAPAFDRIYPWCRKVNIRMVEIDPSVRWDPIEPKLALLEDPEDSARAGGPGRVEVSNPNPHLWLSLSHAVRLVEGIARDVSALDPDHATLYRANADRFQTALRRLKAETEQRLAGVERLSVVSLTEGFPYLTSDLGIQVLDYILSPQDMAQITRRVKASGARVVLAEEPPEPRVAEAVAAGGGRVIVLSTLEEGWGKGDRLDADGYLNGMAENLRTLAEALERP